MGGRYNDDIGTAELSAGREGLSSIGHVSVEQRDRARRYLLEEADLRYPEEYQDADREEWLEEMLGILGLRERHV
jgi:hypothetical protein